MPATKPESVEYISYAEAEQAEKLAGCIAELVTNWLHNNKPEGGMVDPVVLLAAHGRMINMIIGENPCDHCRHYDAAMIIDMILDHSNVDRPEVMAMVQMLEGVSDVGRKLDA